MITKKHTNDRAQIFSPAEVDYIRRRYDILATLRHLAGDETADFGLAREMHLHLQSAAGRDARGFYIPSCILDRKTRTMLGKTNVESHITGNGAAVVETKTLVDQFIPALVAQTILPKLGVDFIPGIVGDVAIPRLGTAPSASWVNAEDGDASDTNPVFNQLTGTPHTAAGRTIISRKLLRQSSLDVEQFVKTELSQSVGRSIEAAVFDGTGADGQPTGVSNTSGIKTCDFATAGTATKADLQKFWQELLNAEMSGSDLAWVGSPAVKALLANSRDAVYFDNTGSKATSGVIGAVGGDYLCTKDSKVEGYNFHISNLCNSKKLYLGDWHQVSVGMWGEGVDILVDPYSYSSKGALQVTCFSDVDVFVRQPAAFAVGTALSA